MPTGRGAKPFRIEQVRSTGPEPETASDLRGSSEFTRLEASIAALRSEVRALAGSRGTGNSSGVDPDVFRQQVIEAERLKADLQELSDAIARTKQEIASLRGPFQDGNKIASASDALKAVVGDTESATNGIINAAEGVEEIAGRLRAQVEGDEAVGMVDELYEHATHIFENCNFQDITGQRITKVVNTMEFIDQRIRRMMDIWGGDPAFQDARNNLEAPRPVGGETLHGPAIGGDGSIGQDEIDALFD